MTTDYFVIAEALHEVQNPTSEEKLLLLGKRLGLGRTPVYSTSRRGAVGRRSCSPGERVAEAKRKLAERIAYHEARIAARERGENPDAATA